MRAPRCLTLVFAFVLAWVGAAPTWAASSPVRITGVMFDGILKGNPEPDSCVRLMNTDKRKAVSLNGYVITDEFTPRKRSAIGGGSNFIDDNRRLNRRGDNDGAPLGQPRRVQLPSIKLAPGQQLWVAHRGDAFMKVFGYMPDIEAVDTLPDVVDADAPEGWIIMPAGHGTVALKDGYGEVVDFVAYDREKEPRYTERDMPSRYWKGLPVRVYGSSPFGWSGQILARDRTEDGGIVDDTDTAADWDSGFTNKQLGEDPVHRVLLPGQSEFIVKPLTSVRARVWATSAPDNNHAALIEAFDGAEERILLSVYQVTNPKVGDALLRAKRRGVDVRLWLEGAPVGGIPDAERDLTDKLARAGVPVYFLASKTDEKVKARYRFDHSKYVIIDDKRAIIGTENYGSTGVPAHPSYGNRGWMVHIEQPVFVRQLRAVWNHDFRPGYRDVVEINDDPADAYGLPFRDKDFQPSATVKRGLYADPVKPLYIADKVDLELVLAPDTSLNENTSIIGMMRRAKHELLLEQNSIRRRWGGREGSRATTPDLPFEAVVEAARRGVKVRVLLDGTWYNIQGDEDRDNDDTVAALNRLARDEGFDVSAKVINLETTHLKKIHAKGIIVDGQEVFVGSINWTENSFKGNREVGVIIGHKAITAYYRDLFLRDWADSRLYEAEVIRSTPLLAGPDRRAKRLDKAQQGERFWVVGEHGGHGNTPGWLEVRTGRARTAFVRPTALGYPEAAPNEAIGLIGRQAIVTGRVAVTRVTSKVIQLKFEDEMRPPFVAVLFKRAAQPFIDQGINPAEAWQGRLVRVKGRVSSWKMPEIVIRGPDSIEVVPEGSARSAAR